MDKRAEKFHHENKTIINQLIEELNMLADKLESGVIPGNPEKTDTISLLEQYLDCLNEFEARQKQIFKKSQVTDKSYEEDKAIRELSGLKNSISLLMKTCREKMLPVDEVSSLDEAEILQHNGYWDELVNEDTQERYYVLSDKGLKAIKSKTFLSKMKENVASSVIPSGMVYESAKWSSLYAKRVDMLNKYYAKQEKKEHIIFTLDEAKEMVFSATLSSDSDVVYVFGGVFDEKIDDHVAQLKDLSGSGLIDKILIATSQEDKRKLESMGLDSNVIPQIEYEVVE